jgi:hypothetical protein
MEKAKPGRKRGSRTRGYYYCQDRGWFALDKGRHIPLATPSGEHIQDKDTDPEVVEQAYQRWKASAESARQATLALGPVSIEELFTRGIMFALPLEYRPARGKVGPLRFVMSDRPAPVADLKKKGRSFPSAIVLHIHGVF